MNDNPDYPQAPPSPPTSPVVQTSTMAIISLISGIVGWFLLPVIGAVVAVITGHMAKSEIRKSMGYLTGDGLATAGLVLGYIQIALGVLSLCLLGVLIIAGVSVPLCIAPWANIQW